MAGTSVEACFSNMRSVAIHLGIPWDPGPLVAGFGALVIPTTFLVTCELGFPTQKFGDLELNLFRRDAKMPGSCWVDPTETERSMSLMSLLGKIC